MTIRTRLLLAGWILSCIACAARADAPSLYGIHWWGYTAGQPIDTAPCHLLDCAVQGGWSVETVLTHSAPWWSASHFAPLYSDLYNNKNISIITRVDYEWGETVPAPTSPGAGTWHNTVVSNVVNTLRHGCRIWQIGNEPNIVDEGANWPNSEVTPAGYAQIYRNVRNAVHANALSSPAGPHVVLIAAPSPGGVIPGIRWMDGNAWLSEVIDNIPNEEIDGFAIHAYGGTVSQFQASFASTLNLIGSKGLQDRPVYMTEWARNKDHPEEQKAQFIRDAFAAVNAWNQTPGNHNIVAMCYFVYDADQQAGGGWNTTSIEYYRDHGIPLGDPNNMFTAFYETARLGYPAGGIGVAPTVAFSATPRSGRAHLDVQFTNETIGAVDSWHWDFGDGGTSTQQHPSHTYTTPGTYTVQLTATSSFGQTAHTESDYITVDFLPGDMNGDGRSDMGDFGLFQACYSGPGIPQTDPACRPARLDDDDDVDLDDFLIFSGCMSGANLPIDPDCAD